MLMTFKDRMDARMSALCQRVADRLPARISAFTVPKGDESYTKPPSQRQLSSIAHHDTWLALYDELAAADADAAADATIRNRECSRIVSASADHSGDWLNAMPTTAYQRSDKYVVGLQRRTSLRSARPRSAPGGRRHPTSE